VNENAARGQLPVNQDGLAAWSAVLSGVVAITNSAAPNRKVAAFSPFVIEPAGAYNAFNAAAIPPVARIVNGINATRTNTGLFSSRSFQHVGDVLATPELTVNSPFLNRSTDIQRHFGLNDSAYEWLPQQIMSLLRLGEPRFVIYAYGQALAPADSSVVTANGPYFGLCTNYQITAEVAARAVVRVEGSPNPADVNESNPKFRYPPRLVVESYNVLGPE
jgi:hypothetical protein